MHEVEIFLQQAWAAAESARRQAWAAAENARIAKEVEELQRKIASRNDAIAREWKRVGLAVAAEVGLIIVAFSLNSSLNSGGIIGLLAALVGFVFALGFWIGLVIVAGMVLIVLFNTIIRLPSIAKLNTEIRSLQASRPMTI